MTTRSIALFVVTLLPAFTNPRDAMSEERDSPKKTADDSQKRDFPFAIRRDAIGVSFGIKKVYAAYPKDGHDFLVVAIRQLPKGKRMPGKELNLVIVDEDKTQYAPIAFGAPQVGCSEPFVVLGRELQGEIAIEDADGTLIALFYLVPVKSKRFQLENAPDGQNKVAVLDTYKPPIQTKILGFRVFGDLVFGYPDKSRDGWGSRD